VKNIVLCADGTWNTPVGVGADAGGTNVWKLYCAAQDTPTQLKYYDSGVGTDGTPISHLTGGAMGEGLFQKVQDCYTFLAHVHDPGDRIYIFGFSRGAYTARSVGGMIAAFGVPSINLSNATTPEIFAAYRERDPAKRAALKQHLTESYGLQPVNIAMVGVWDTVGSLGIPGALFEVLNEGKYGFLDTTLSDCVDHAYHAISIDERRMQFAPTLWTNKDGSYRTNDARCEQVWFPGVHCDVGGSYADGDLADITLGWMMHKATEHGVQFAPEIAAKYLTLPAGKALGNAHDEWKILPWGLPKHRTIPPGASLANSVGLRCTSTLAPAYRPSNLTFQDDKLHGYAETAVLPYTPPAGS